MQAMRPRHRELLGDSSNNGPTGDCVTITSGASHDDIIISPEESGVGCHLLSPSLHFLTPRV